MFLLTLALVACGSGGGIDAGNTTGPGGGNTGGGNSGGSNPGGGSPGGGNPGGGGTGGGSAVSNLTLSPAAPLAATGLIGASFSTATMTYDAGSNGQAELRWSANASQSWISLSSDGGTLPVGNSIGVVVGINSLASTLPVGTHSGQVVFTNLDQLSNTHTRDVTLTLTAPGSLPMTTATRTTGVAPLMVVFDPLGSGTGVVQPSGATPDHASFSYAWDFGDPGILWGYSGRSANRSGAWIGAHVFETPGTYRVTLKVIDDQGGEHDYHQDITVTDPAQVFAQRTFYVAANGNDGGPGTEAAPFLTAQRGITALMSSTTAGRLRFRRGDTFISANEWTLSNSGGPFLIDAFGSGNRPRQSFSGQYVGINLVGTQDVRVQDLELVSTSTTQANWATGVRPGTRTLVSGCLIQSFGHGFHSADKNETCLHDSEVLDSTEYSSYLAGNGVAHGLHHAVLGSRFDGSGQHLMRTYLNRSVIQACVFEDAGVSAMKLVGRPLPNPTQHVCVMDNDIRTEVISDPVGIGPQNGLSNEHAVDYQVEGNRFYSRSAGNNCLQVRGYRVVVRNNVFDVDGRRAVRVDRWGVGPMPYAVVIENNTARSVGSQLNFVWANSSDQTIVRNNLLTGNGTIETPQGTVSTQQNLTVGASVFAPLAGILGGEFALTTSGSNVAVDTGAPARVRFDYAGRSRMNSGALDVGAFERQ
jgi:hypothetical protein